MKEYHKHLIVPALVFLLLFVNSGAFAQVKAPVAKKAASTEEVVDLGAFNAPTEPPPPAPSAPNKVPAKKSPLISFPGQNRGPSAGGDPEAQIRFKVYFDLNLYSRPGIADLGFDNFHAFLFMEGTPMPDMQFSFDVSPSPRFYELDWQVLPQLQLRMGKIWIPFDDTSIHNIYGGRVNVSKLQLGSAFLPDIWTDLGVGVKWTIRDVRDLNLIGDLYVVNGFRSGGSDPVNPSNPYPSFSDLSTSADNNRDKAVGGRLHGLFWNRLGLGVSAYDGRWSDQTLASYRISMFGGDAQFKFPATMSELRVGILTMKVGIPGATIYRAGTYAEVGQYLTRSRSWKFLLRGGTLQMDDRVNDVNDQRIVGAMLIWRPNFIQFSLEHSNDIQRISGKLNYAFTNLRMAIMF